MRKDLTHSRDSNHEVGDQLPTLSDGSAGRFFSQGRSHLGSSPKDEAAAQSFSSAADLRLYWRILRNRWPIVLTAFSVVFAAVGIGTFLQDPIYRATGMIEIRKQTAEVLPAEAVFQMARIGDQYLETEYEVLRSPALALRVLDDRYRTVAEDRTPSNGSEVGQSGAGPTITPAASTDRDIGWFQKRLIVDPVRGSRLVRISFDSEDPHLAAQMVNAVVANYTEMRIAAGRTAEKRLAEQLDSVRTQLNAAEHRLQEYVRGSELLFVENQAGESENIVHERLRHLQQELTEAEAERYAKQSRDNLVQQRGSENLDSDVMRSLNVRIADLRGEYAKLRSTFTDDYPRTRQVKNQLNELEALLTSERNRIAAEISNDYQAAVRRQELLRAAFNDQKARVDQLAGQTAEYRVLKRDVESHRDLFALLQQKRREAGVSAALAASEVGVVNLADTPQEPIRPVPAKNLKLAAIVGLLLGIGLAFMREYLDTTITTAEEVGSFSPVPILAAIPAIGSRESDQQRSVLGEAFGSLRTSVLFDVTGPPPRSLLVTSTQPQEGKTTVSVNLAISLAKLGRRVLLIDADIRRPAVQRTLKIEAGAGLADYLAGRMPWRLLVRADVVPGLDVLSAGDPPESPSEMLSSVRMGELVREAEVEYDFVVLDSPALLIHAADARILAPLVDGVLVVVRSRATPRDALTRALNQVPNLLGVVLNDLDIRSLPPAYHYYSTAVGERSERA